jgi:hypothetical protein
VVPIIPGQSWTKNYQVKRPLAHGLVNTLATHGRLDLMARLLDRNCLGGNHFRVALAVENPELK